MKSKIIARTLGAAALMALMAGNALAQTVIRLSYELPVTHEFHEGAEMLAELVRERTDGSVRIELYPAGQLTGDGNFPREIMAGTVDAGLSPTLYWTRVMPIAGIFDVPYLVRSHQEAQQVLSGEVGQRLLDGLEEFDAVGLGYFNYGFGIYGTTDRRLLEPSDFAGLAMRTNNDIGAQLLQAFGASPTFMSGGEVYLGLQQGTIDGTHTGLSSVLSRSMYEVLNYLTVDNHNMIPYFVMVRKPVFDRLSPEEQEILREAVVEAGAWVAKAQEEADDNAAEALREHGVTVDVLTPEQLTPWAEASESVVDYWLNIVGDEGRELIAAVEQALGR